MSFYFLNRCIWTAAAGGLSDFTVGAAALGGYTPAQCANPSVVSGGSYHYFAINGTTEHEEGDGVYSAGVLTRATVRNSSNSGAKVNFSAAPTVFMGGPVADDVGHLFEILAPNITSAASFSANVGDSGTLYTGTATTPIGRQVFTWSLSGTDAADFDINSSTGVITFNNPSGVSDGSKSITLHVTDGVLPDQLAITVTVSTPTQSTTFDPASKGSDITLSESDWTAENITANWNSVFSTTSKTGSQKVYIEFKLRTVNDASHILMGLGYGTLNGSTFITNGTNGFYVRGNGGSGNGSGIFTLDTSKEPSYSGAANGVIGIAIDITNGKAWSSYNNTYFGDPAAGTNPCVTWTPGSQVFFAAASLYGASPEKLTIHTHSSTQAYAPPSGFSRWDPV